jgi:hypothetical protein
MRFHDHATIERDRLFLHLAFQKSSSVRRDAERRLPLAERKLTRTASAGVAQ